MLSELVQRHARGNGTDEWDTRESAGANRPASGAGPHSPGELASMAEFQRFAAAWFATPAVLPALDGSGSAAGARRGRVPVRSALVFVAMDAASSSAAGAGANESDAGAPAAPVFVAVCGEGEARGALKRLGGSGTRLPARDMGVDESPVLVTVPCDGLLEEVRRTMSVTRYACRHLGHPPNPSRVRC